MSRLFSFFVLFLFLGIFSSCGRAGAPLTPKELGERQDERVKDRERLRAPKTFILDRLLD